MSHIDWTPSPDELRELERMGRYDRFAVTVYGTAIMLFGAGMLWRLDTAYLAATVSFLTCSFLYGWLNVRSWRLMHRSALRRVLADVRREEENGL